MSRILRGQNKHTISFRIVLNLQPPDLAVYRYRCKQNQGGRKMRKFLFLICTTGIINFALADTIDINWMIGDSVYDTSTCTVGGDLILPTAPTKYGYTFQGWTQYIPLEYIESTGIQYINTNITGSTNAVIDMQGIAISDELVRFVLSPINATTYTNAFGIYRNQISGFSNINAQNRQVYNISYDANSITVNGIRSTGYHIENNVNLSLFGNYQAARRSYIKLYSAKIYNNNTLLRDFVPVKRASDNVVGLYDLVSDTFFTNALSGSSFSAGPAID